MIGAAGRRDLVRVVAPHNWRLRRRRQRRNLGPAPLGCLSGAKEGDAWRLFLWALLLSRLHRAVWLSCRTGDSASLHCCVQES